MGTKPIIGSVFYNYIHKGGVCVYECAHMHELKHTKAIWMKIQIESWLLKLE